MAAQELPLESARNIEHVCTEYESQMQRLTREGRNDLRMESFLEGFCGREREALLEELVALDFELRSGKGQKTTELDYQDFSAAIDREVAAKVFRQLLTQRSTNIYVGGKVLDRYELEKQVGTGGIGVVWRVYDLQSERPLAIKLLHLELRQNEHANSRLLREALLTGKLQHPGIPPVYDHGEFDSGAYFVMKLVEGNTLETILKDREEHGNTERYLGLFVQIAQTLAYAHSQGVVHRDVKPHNVMVGRFGEVQLMDWGMAKQLGDDVRNEVGSNRGADDTQEIIRELDSRTPAMSGLTRDGDIVGTPSYMSPEQARGELELIDQRSDVFGLGAILYQILTFERLFEGKTASEVLEKCARGELEHAWAKLEAMPDRPEIVNLCRKCLCPDPSERPSDAEEVSDIVAKYLSSLQEKLQNAEVAKAQTETLRIEGQKRQRMFLGMLSIIACFALSGLLIVTWQWSNSLKLASSESKAKVLAESEAVAVNEINDFLNAIIASVQPNESGYDVTVQEAIAAIVLKLDEKFETKPRVEGSIRQTLGETYRWLGELDEAEFQHRKALDAFRRTEPMMELEELNTMDRLAGVLRSRRQGGDLQEASKLRSQVLDRRMKLLGESHPDTIQVMNNLATVYTNMRRFAEASELYERALRIIESERLDQETETIRYNLAWLAWERGELDEAESRFRKFLPDLENVSDQILIANFHTVYGEFLGEIGKFEESEEQLRLAILTQTELYGQEHPRTLSAMRKLGRMLVASGNFELALKELLSCLKIHESTYGEDSGYTFSVREWIPRALVGLQRLAEAEEFLEATVEILRAGRGKEHEYTQDALQQLKKFRNLEE